MSQGTRLNRLGLTWKSLLKNPGATVVLLLFALLVGFGTTAAPRFVNQRSDLALTKGAAEVSATQRNLAFIQYRRISADRDDTLGAIRQTGEELGSGIAGALGRASTLRAIVLDSPMLQVQDLPILPGRRVDRYFTFRALDGGEQEIAVVAGESPVPRGEVEVVLETCDPEQDEAAAEESQDDPCNAVALPLFETAVTRETAEALRMELGDRVLLEARVDIPNNRGLARAGLDYQLVLELSGIIELSDANSDVWQGDTLLHRPTRVPVGFTEFDVFGAGWLSPDDYQRLLDEVLPSRFLYSWRFSVDHTQIDSSNAENVKNEINRLDLEYQGSDAINRPLFRTGIDQIITAYEGERDITTSMASLMLVGLAGLIVASSMVLGALTARRRQATTLLIRGRGGSPGELTLARFAEAVAILVSAAVAGHFLAEAMVAGRSAENGLAWAVVAGMALAIVYTTAALPSIAGDLGRLLSNRIDGPGSKRRLVVELLFLALAVGGVVLFRRRGVGTSSGIDLLLASVPILVSIAAGIVLLRLLPLVFRMVSGLMGRVRGIVGMIGFRSITGRGIAAHLPPVIALIGVSVAVFGVLFSETVHATQDRGSWQEVGANYRLEPFNPRGTVSPQFDLEDIPGVEQTADAVLATAGVAENGIIRGSIQLLAVDVDDYQAVAASTDADPRLPKSLIPANETDSGTESNPIPALVSSSWPNRAPHVGEILRLSVDLRPVVAVVEEIRDEFPGLDPSRPFVVMSRRAVSAVAAPIPTQPNRQYVRAPDSTSDLLAESTREQQPGLRFVSRPDRLAAVRERPAVGAIGTIATIVFGAAIVLAGVSVAAGFALTSRERARDMGYLRAIGLSASQMWRAIVAEQAVPMLTAVVLGATTGIVTWYLVGPSLALESVTGTTLRPETVVAWPAIAVVALLIAGTSLSVTAIYSYLNREMDLANVLRRGDRP